MAAPQLTRYSEHGVTLLGDRRRPGGVTFAFTERTGGVSEGPFASLNLGANHGDDAAVVRENRRRALGALGLGPLSGRLVVPRQVHGSHVVVVDSTEPDELARIAREADAGADAVVCAVPDVPVMLLSADCALVVIVCEGAFAVAHSGWRGTLAGISALALTELCRVTGASADDATAYVGPHIGREDYEVSRDLLDRFRGEFGDGVEGPRNTLDLSCAIRASLLRAGIGPDRVLIADVSTARAEDRFFSWRRQGGICGRNAAIACVTGREG